MKKTCPKCGAAFVCLKNNCWCEKIKLSKEKLQDIEKRYKGCLCKKCLISS